MDESWTVPLPAGVTEPFEVYVNGVRQEPGVDFSELGGTSRKNDSVDVVYEAGGRRVVASGLPIIPPGGPEPPPSS